MKIVTGRPKNHDEYGHLAGNSVMLFVTSLIYHIHIAGGGNAA